MLTDPIYSRRAKKTEEKFKTCLTEIKKTMNVNCPLCKTGHHLDDFIPFREKGPRDKKDFLFKSKLCFACYGIGHGVKKL